MWKYETDTCLSSTALHSSLRSSLLRSYLRAQGFIRKATYAPWRCPTVVRGATALQRWRCSPEPGACPRSTPERPSAFSTPSTPRTVKVWRYSWVGLDWGAEEFSWGGGPWAVCRQWARGSLQGVLQRCVGWRRIALGGEIVRDSRSRRSSSSGALLQSPGSVRLRPSGTARKGGWQQSQLCG